MGTEKENTRTPSLWELGREEEEIIAAVIDAEGELTTDQQERLDALELAKADKVDAYHHVDMTLGADIDMLKKEEERLRKKRQTLENARKGLKDYLIAYMDAHGITKILGKFAGIYARNNPEGVACNEDALKEKIRPQVEEFAAGLPGYYTVEIKVNRTVLKDMARNGEPVPEGVSLTRGRSVTIR